MKPSKKVAPKHFSIRFLRASHPYLGVFCCLDVRRGFNSLPLSSAIEDATRINVKSLAKLESLAICKRVPEASLRALKDDIEANPLELRETRGVQWQEFVTG